MDPQQISCCKPPFLAVILTYFKTNIRQKFYRPLGFANLVFGFDGELGYIGAYGDTKITPFL